MRILAAFGMAAALAGLVVGCTDKEPEPAPKPTPTPAATATPAAQATPQVIEKGDKIVATPQEGSPAPDFTLPATGGGEVSLASFKGKSQVVLYFYPRDDTPGCTKESCSFRDNIAGIEGKDAVVLGVSRDSLASHEKFINKYSLPFALLSDTDGKVCTAYGALVEKDGKKKFQRSTYIIGKDGNIKKAFPKVTVNGHTEEVLAALD